MALKLVLPEFQGPLDLLWYLIKSAKIDIYDIPIAEITNQYLAYLHQSHVMQLETVGDYLVMAANLMEIKSKLLLPAAQPAPEDELPLDPRDELVSQLLSYQAYQQAAKYLDQKARKRAQFFVKQPSPLTTDQAIPLKRGAVHIDQLQQTMQNILQKQLDQKPVQRTVPKENYSVSHQVKIILRYLRTNPGLCHFTALLSHPENRQVAIDEMVTTFLALLELIKNGAVDCKQNDYQDEILIKKLEA